MIKIKSKIKLVVSDFDGVFTDGGFFIDENLKQHKKMNFKDIMGVYILLRHGVKFAIITGEENGILNYFREKLKIEDIFMGIRDKEPVLDNIMKKYDLKKEEVLYVGDDINDIGAFNIAGYKVAPNDANYKIKKIKGIQITKAKGGCGAIREITDSIIESLGKDERLF